jgi:hypothetical protein
MFIDTPKGVTTAPMEVKPTLAVPDCMGSACDVAETSTVAGLGTAVGDVYRPELVTVPTVLLPPAIPFTLQSTPRLPVPDTVAVNCWVVVQVAPLRLTETEEGETLTPIVMVTLAVAIFVVSA